MTAPEFDASLAQLGWSFRHLAWRLGCSKQLPQRWANGSAPVPPSIARWLAALVRALERHPVPDDWRVRG